MVCRNVCDNIKAKKPNGTSRYLVGQKRCQTCCVFLKYDGLYCPCCNMRLRTKSRYIKLKELVLELPRIH